MLKLKQGTAAIALVATVGLVMPSTLGGPVSADISPNNPNGDRVTLACDLDRDGDNDVQYEVVTTSSTRMWQDLRSTTVLVEVTADQHRTYTPLPAPPDDPGAPVDPRAPFQFTIIGEIKGNKGRLERLVPCQETQVFDLIGDGFPVDATGNPVEVAGAHYSVVNTITWWVAISGGPTAKAASADGSAQSADRPTPGKHKTGGKHRGKGKRGR